MAHEDFIKFLEDVNGDEALQGRVAELPAGTDRESLEALAELGAAHGRQFSVQDVDDLVLAAAVNEAREAGGELSLEELDTAAGGVVGLSASAMRAPSSALSRLGANASIMGTRMQQAAQQRSQFISTLSNLMKRQHDTAMSLINNIR